jgi:hexosaminidase
MEIFPIPASLRMKKQEYDYSDSRWIQVSSVFSSNFKKRVFDFKNQISNFFKDGLQITSGNPEKGDILLTIELDESLKSENYIIDCKKDMLVVKAGDETGAFYGLQTLSQVIQSEGACFKGFKIEDGPDFSNRGIMLDISRTKVPTMDTLYKIVDMMASVKLNQLQLYTEHTFAFSGHERVWAEASPMTSEEILLLDAYCKERYIELVPNLNSFGHMERWLKYDEYKHMAECPDGSVNPWGGKSACGSVLKPNQNSLNFIDSLYREMVPNFSSKYLNIGCDETWELGQGWSKKLAEEKGSTRIYLDFLLKITELVRKYNKRIQFWGDIIIKEPELVKELPKDIIALEWGYKADHPYSDHCRLFKESGVPFYVCPGTSSWNSITGRVNNCLANIENAAKNGLKNGAIGLLNTDWGDGGHHQYLPISYIGYFAGAAYSWNFKKNRESDIAEAVSRLAVGDESNTIGQLLFEFGNVYLTFAKTQQVNNNTFSHLARCDMQKHNCENITKTELKNALKAFAKIKTKLDAAKNSSEEVALVKAEFSNSIAMATLAVKKGLYIKDKSTFDKSELLAEAAIVVGNHQKLWLQRNRIGGLQESSDKLKNGFSFK